jgi:DNA-directed RNA polymerase subunit M/transcription elongation factor TFIIS
MPITILEYVKAKLGDFEAYSEEDHWHAGVAMFGGCQTCYAALTSYNAYPSRHGFWRCLNCIADDGFPTVADFEARRVHCPACGNIDTIGEYQVPTAWGDEETQFECGECGEVWQS